MAAAPQAGLDDLSQLHSLDEDSVQDALQARYAQAKIYTHINSLLVAVNPYKQLNVVKTSFARSLRTASKVQDLTCSASPRPLTAGF